MKSIRNKLAIAACTVLSQGAQQAAATETDISHLFYSEADDRVLVNKTIAKFKAPLGGNNVISMEAVYDAITGATPTGAVEADKFVEPTDETAPAADIVTVTTPSGGSIINIGTNNPDAPVIPQSTPTLIEFDDTRIGVDLGLTHSYSRTLKINYGISTSLESDYEAYGGSVTIDKETFNRNLTFSAGIAGSYDTIFQSSGTTPGPRSNLKKSQFFGKGKKRGFEGMLGVSGVTNRRTVTQFNYSIKSQEGYLTDPYKLISMINADGAETDVYYESRPESRLQQTLYSALVHKLNNKDVIHLSYRYYFDDWDINSHTIDYRHRKNFANGQHLEPHLRVYNQTAANFYQNNLNDDGQPLPEYVSADYRLDELSSVTIGAKYGIPAWGGTLRFRLEYLYQSFSEAEFDTNKAVIFQASYKKKFN